MDKFIPFSQVSLVNGYSRGGLIDHDQYKLFFFPSNFIDTISKPIDLQILRSGFSECIDVINDNELGLFLSEGDNFSKMSYNYEHYSFIDNIVFCLDPKSNVLELIDLINLFQIRALKLIVCDYRSEDLNSLFKLLFKSTIEHIQCTFPSRSQLEGVNFSHPGICFVNIHDIDANYVEDLQGIKVFGDVIWPLQTMTLALFTESQTHHTYFNRKLYIGSKGEIKNAPECEESFGYIHDLKSIEELSEIVQGPEFQKYWFVRKDICDVCKDCEFRHMCVDNRLPYQRNENEWYHKIECNYNPYITKWKGEEGYRTLEECGVISNKNSFSIDHDRIAAINEELWGGEG